MPPQHVERERALEPRLLSRREEQLDAGVRASLGQDEPRRFEQNGHRRLVVGPQDGVCAVRDDPVRDDGLDRSRNGHGVEVGAEKDRRPGLARGRGQAGEEVPGLVLDRLDAQVTEVGTHPGGDLRLLPGWARNGRELEEERKDVGGPGGRHLRDCRRRSWGRDGPHSAPLRAPPVRASELDSNVGGGPGCPSGR